MIHCFNFGWKPVIDELNIREKFRPPVSGNYFSQAIPHKHCEGGRRYEMHGVVVRCLPHPRGVILPLGYVVIEVSDAPVLISQGQLFDEG